MKKMIHGAPEKGERTFSMFRHSVLRVPYS